MEPAVLRSTVSYAGIIRIRFQGSDPLVDLSQPGIPSSPLFDCIAILVLPVRKVKNKDDSIPVHVFLFIIGFRLRRNDCRSWGDLIERIEPGAAFFIQGIHHPNIIGIGERG